jgi:hypothetical protein
MPINYLPGLTVSTLFIKPAISCNNILLMPGQLLSIDQSNLRWISSYQTKIQADLYNGEADVAAGSG